MEIVGDFSLIIPYGVRVMGFPCDSLGLRVARSNGLGLRVFQGIGSGLRIRSPDVHVILLIPLYLIWGVFVVSFPHPLFPSSPLCEDLCLISSNTHSFSSRTHTLFPLYHHPLT